VFDNYIQEPAYLTGMIAGGMTKSNIIGMVGGYPIPEVNRLMNAFMEGAKEVNPKVKFTISFIGSWFDPPKAKEAAFAMIDKGADVLYAERFGVSDAAKEKGKLAIGNVINTQDKYPDTVVASALWNMEPTVDRALKAVKDGKFKAEDYGSYSMMKYKGSELAAARNVRQEGSGRPRQEGEGQGEGDPGRQVHGQGQRQRAQVHAVAENGQRRFFPRR
jgi:basic membrane lipoprotein Med (substrate-binding protein (PBP1-ABC) superfamily)